MSEWSRGSWWVLAGVLGVVGVWVPRVGVAGDVGVEGDAGTVDAGQGASERGDAGVGERLERGFGVSGEVLESVSALMDRRAGVEAETEELESATEDLKQERLEARAELEGLVEQVERAETEPAVGFVRGIARRSVGLARVEARLEHVRAGLARDRRLVSLLEERLEAVRAGPGAGEASERSASRVRAKQTEREAKRAVEESRRREREERGRRLKELHKRQREVAEKRLASTREFQETIRRVREETSELRESFAEERAELVEEVDGLPEAPSREVRAEEVDPVFEELQQLHREVLDAHADAVEARGEAAERLAEARRLRRDARADFRERRRQSADYEESEIRNRRVALAEDRVKLRRQEFDEAEDLLEARRRRARVLREQLGTIEEAMRDLLPRVSGGTWDAYYDVFDEGRWAYAWKTVGWRLESIYDRARERGRQALEMVRQPFEFGHWDVVGGVVWRLLVLVGLLRVVFPTIRPLADGLTASLLKRRFFRSRPGLTVKSVEALVAVVRPVSVYLVVVFVGGYLAESLPELEVVLWVVDAVFVYWLAMGVLSALVHPDQLERDPGSGGSRSSRRLGTTPLEEARAAAALTAMEPARADKFLRSARVVVVFWIVAAFVPDFLARVTGPTVSIYVVRQAATWGFAVVVYWVLSTWRDHIAELFGRLATPRLDRGVDFVRRHKDRPWGVLVIGLASIYVVAVELVRLARLYLSRTEWFQRARDFAFQKTVELQRVGEEEGRGFEMAPALDLPEAYTSLFDAEPLEAGDERIVERDQGLAEVRDHYDRWCERRRQGAVALVGESGIGRTTLMHRIEAELGGEEASPVLAEQVEAKFARPGEVLAWLAGVFGLEGEYEERMELVERLRELEPRTILLDDCENLFVRRTGGFEGLEALLDVVTLTDEHHFWVLSFHDFSWAYVNRIRERRHYFGEVVEIEPWAKEEIRELVEKRNEGAEPAVSYRTLESADRSGEVSDRFVDVAQAAEGYYRYLTTFAEGNPWVAATFWLRSLEYREERGQLDVHLFRRPAIEPLVDLEDDYWFALTAIAQHGELGAGELAEATNIDEEFCVLALDYFQEVGVVEVDWKTGRGRLGATYFRQVLKHLSDSNFLYS